MKTLLFIFMIGLISLTINAQDIKIENGLYCKSGVAYTGEATIKAVDGSTSILNISEGKLQGDAVYYYASGKVKEQGAYVAGAKHGIWVRFNETGLKVGEGEYFNGKKHGKWLVWDDNGVKRYEMSYMNGDKYSTWFSWDEKGELIASTNYDKG